jgi:RNA processing factor Prp31
MKRIFFVGCFSIIITLASCEYKIDKSDIFKIGNALNESFLRNDEEILKKLFIYNMDSINEYTKSQIEEIKKRFNGNLKFLEMDTITIAYGLHFLELYYRDNNDYYRIVACYNKDKLNQFNLNFMGMVNLNTACEESEKNPYCPKEEIDFREFSWSFDSSAQRLHRLSLIHI